MESRYERLKVIATDELHQNFLSPQLLLKLILEIRLEVRDYNTSYKMAFSRLAFVLWQQTGININITKQEVAALSISTVWCFIHCFQTKWNFKMLAFVGGEKPEYPGKTPRRASREPTTNATHIMAAPGIKPRIHHSYSSGSWLLIDCLPKMESYKAIEAKFFQVMLSWYLLCYFVPVILMWWNWQQSSFILCWCQMLSNCVPILHKLAGIMLWNPTCCAWHFDCLNWTKIGQSSFR